MLIPIFLCNWRVAMNMLFLLSQFILVSFSCQLFISLDFIGHLMLGFEGFLNEDTFNECKENLVYMITKCHGLVIQQNSFGQSSMYLILHNFLRLILIPLQIQSTFFLMSILKLIVNFNHPLYLLLHHQNS